MSSGALRKNDTLSGTAGEHGGHYDEDGNPIHSNVTVTGVVATGSSNVNINGMAAACKGDITNENDACDGSQHGSVGSGSNTVFINGKPAARKTDTLNQHSGSGSFTSSSNNVFIGN